MDEEYCRDAESRPLGILGISEDEEHIYRWLLTHSGASISDIATAIATSPAKAQRLVDVVEAKGLVTHTPERPRRYIPASPDIALKALSLHRQQELKRVDGVIQDLQALAITQRQGQQEQIVELLTSREAEAQVLGQMHKGAKSEFITLIRMPLRVSQLDVPVEQDRQFQREAQTRGVLYKSIIDAECLELPEVLQSMRQDIEAGEEVRVCSNLPFKRVLVDSRLALIPLNLRLTDGPSLLVRSSALLDALHTLFEILWQQAAPISFTREGTMKRGDPDSWLSNEARNLMSLLAAGLNDKNIAHELGVTTRTLQRRVTALMQTLDARTRFQLGWLGALHLFASDVLSGIQDSPDK
ncbi:MAG: helix-turn-helix domain-containing protein [Ktedonobacteraceae bacterium]